MPDKLLELPFTGGVNRNDAVSRIRADQAYSLKNLIPVEQGILGTRGGMSHEQVVVGGAPFDVNSTSTPLAGLFLPRPVGTANIVVAYFGNGNLKFVATTYGGGTASVKTFTVAAANVERRPSLVYFNKKVYAFVGTPLSAMSGYVLSETGVGLGWSWADFNFNGAQATRPIPSGMCMYRRRAVFWDLGTGYEDHLVFSDTDDPATVGAEILAANGRAFRVGSRDAGRVICCTEVMLSEASSPGRSALLVLRERGAYLLTGEPNQSTDVTDFIGDMDVAEYNVKGCGCVSAATVVRTPEGVIWTGEDDVWCLKVGNVPFRVGTNITDVLKEQPASKRFMLNAAYFDGYYRLMAFDSQAAPVLTDPLYTQWWLRTKEGLPPDASQCRWFGPHAFFPYADKDSSAALGTYAMFREARSNQADALYGLHLGADSGAYAILLTKYDQDSTEDIACTSTEGPTYERNANGITWEAISKDNDFAEVGSDKNTDKVWTGLELSVYSSRPCTINVADIIDQTETYDADVAVPECLTDEFKAILAYPDDDERPLGKRHQFDLAGPLGYTIDETNNKISIGVDGPMATVVVTEVTITSGFYTNLYRLLQQIIADIEVDIPWTWSHNIINDANGRAQFVELTNGLAVQWYARPTGSSDEALALWDLLGFTATVGAADANTAPDEVLWALSQKVRLGGTIARVNPIPRRPSGA